MKYIKVYLFVVLALAAFACSDLKDVFTTPQKVNVHSPEFLKKSSANFHGNFIKNSNWDLTQCQKCPASNYAGGPTEVSCLSSGCHNQEAGPEACNTCHGDFNNPSHIAPPQDINNHSETSYASVGAHSAHLNAGALGKVVECQECHTIPAHFSSPGHIDNSIGAELVFGTLSNMGPSASNYIKAGIKCSNTYCHGNFAFAKENSRFKFAYTADKMTGRNYSPVWNKVDGTQKACNTCHGLPPAGHIPSALDKCATCHIGIMDQAGHIINTEKHINGIINVFGN